LPLLPSALIDLHLHTTASDGRLTPSELVDRAVQAGLTVMAVTDHDTVKAVDEVTSEAAVRAIRVIPGIEVTAVDEERDVHMLAYFVDHHDTALTEFLGQQRGRREERAREIGRRLAAWGAPIDHDALIARARNIPGKSIARPSIARALVRAGHAASVEEAFDRWLARGRPAFVPRLGPAPADVLTIVHAARGIVSLAHPGVTRKDHLIAPLAEAGLDALEIHHSDHLPEVREHYRSVARALGLATSGGSDFHGYGETRATLGVVHLPAHEFAELEARAAARRRAAVS
jgi:predicted metal-dependent phosphoesterase TrpH